MRSRVLNPRWIDGMRRHGYKGAFEMAATVDYLFGYDATTDVVEDWMYERVTDAYVADPAMRAFFEQSNPMGAHVDRRAAARGRPSGGCGGTERRRATKALRRRRARSRGLGGVASEHAGAVPVLRRRRPGRRQARPAAGRHRPGHRRRAAPRRQGSAKTTLARGLAALLPRRAPFVELPLGATEDRVVGGLDLGAALSGDAVQLRPGLLAAADGGVLYVDEVNLLPDHLVDVLLDAAASGVNRVERDGVSHTHPARFVLVGSMNPEEGELRPQLLDRFGLAVEVRARAIPSVRSEVVSAGCASSGASRSNTTTAAWPARLASSHPAALPDEVVDFACRLAVAAGAEGLRGDLVLCRAGAALAGWEGRARPRWTTSNGWRPGPRPPPPAPAVRPAGLPARRAAPGPRPGPIRPGTGPGRPAGRTAGTALAGPTAGTDRSGTEERRSAPADRGRPIPIADGGRPVGGSGRSGLDSRPGQLRLPPPIRPAPPATGPAARGPVIGSAPGADGPIGIAVAATLRAGMHRRVAHPDTPAVTAADLREPVRPEARTRCIVLAVDTSSSMGSRTRAEAATGAVLGLLADAYRRRHRVALVAFRGQTAEVALAPTASVEIARARLADLAVGGATPLAEGLDAGPCHRPAGGGGRRHAAAGRAHRRPGDGRPRRP